MKEDKKNIEDLFEVLRNEEAPVSSGSWNKIAKQLPKQTPYSWLNKKNIIGWGLGCVTLMFVATSFYLSKGKWEEDNQLPINSPSTLQAPTEITEKNKEVPLTQQTIEGKPSSLGQVNNINHDITRHEQTQPKVKPYVKDSLGIDSVSKKTILVARNDSSNSNIDSTILSTSNVSLIDSGSIFEEPKAKSKRIIRFEEDTIIQTDTLHLNKKGKVKKRKSKNG